jgi:hypothetical protein
MVKKGIYLLFLFLLFSCEEEGIFTTNEAKNQLVTYNPEADFVELYRGTFNPTSGISVNGEAVIYQQEATRYVSLENFSISSGPDLKVYLSKSASPNDFVNLGNLTSATKYAIPNEVDLEVYTFVLIHCQQYNHLFAIADLN